MTEAISRPDADGETVDRDDIDTDTAEQAALPLLATVIVSPAAHVAAVLDVLTPDDVRLLDPPTAVALTAALDLAQRGTDPAAVLVLDELRRTGQVGDGRRRLVCTRLEDAVTTYQPAERLRPLAAALAAQLLRIRGAVAGEAITAGYRTETEDDAFTTLCREGSAVRRIRDTVTALRGTGVSL